MLADIQCLMNLSPVKSKLKRFGLVHGVEPCKEEAGPWSSTGVQEGG